MGGRRYETADDVDVVPVSARPTGFEAMENVVDGPTPSQPKIEKGLKLTRFKGLGEMNPDELFETSMDPDNRILMPWTTPQLRTKSSESSWATP